MATAAHVASSEPSDHECSICSELFTCPKLLPCCHLLCRHCLVDLLKSQPRAQCPLCRTPIAGSAASPGRNWEAIADGFPTDLAMAEVAELERLLKTAHPCCACVGAAATAVCLDCGDMFCGSCQGWHTRQRVAKDHRLQDLSSLSADQLACNRPPPCPAHPDRPCELFCPGHSASMCHACFTSRHRRCPDVTDLQLQAEESRSTLAQLGADLRAAERDLDLVVDRLAQHLLETKEETAAGLAALKNVCDRLKSAVDARYQSVKEEADQACSDVTGKVQTGRAHLLRRRGNATSRRRAVQRAEEATGCHVVNAMTSVMTLSAESIDCSTTLPEGTKPMTSVTVDIDPGVLTFIEQKLVTLGRVIVSTDVTPWQTSASDVTTGASAFVTNRQKDELRFHDNYGKNILLSNNNRIAKRTGAQFDNGGLVMGCLPMTVNLIYQIRVDDTAGHTGWPCPVGVVTDPPDAISLPTWAGGLTPAVVVWWDCVYVNGQRDNNIKIGGQLKSVSEKNRIGVLIDDRRALHLYINGEDQGVAAPAIPEPCYPLFDVCGPYKKITALPVERIK